MEDEGEPIDNPEGQKEEQGILGTIRHWIMPDTAETPESKNLLYTLLCAVCIIRFIYVYFVALDKPADYGKSDAEIAKGIFKLSHIAQICCLLSDN